ncbi:MAG: hypothetical protein ABIE70_04440 [bacterium]
MRCRTLLLFGILVICNGSTGAQALLLDHVDGSPAPGTIATNQVIAFHIRLQTDSLNVRAMANGYRVYSDDGAQWDTTTGVFTGAIDSSLMPMQFVTAYSDDGVGADTIGFAAMAWIDLEPGLPPGFDEIVYTTSIGPIGSEYNGHTVCLDSSFYRPGNNWKWVLYDDANTAVYPDWDGPHCFEVVDENCCVKRGDIDHDGVGPMVADLVYLANYVLENGPPPPCPAEADVDGDGAEIGEADLIYLMNYMFSRTCQVPRIVSCRGSADDNAHR